MFESTSHVEDANGVLISLDWSLIDIKTADTTSPRPASSAVFRFHTERYEDNNSMILDWFMAFGDWAKTNNWNIRLSNSPNNDRCTQYPFSFNCNSSSKYFEDQDAGKRTLEACADNLGIKNLSIRFNSSTSS